MRMLPSKFFSVVISFAMIASASGSAEAQRRESRYAHPSLSTSPTSPVLAPAFESETDRLTKTVVRDGSSITFMPSGEE